MPTNVQPGVEAVSSDAAAGLTPLPTSGRCSLLAVAAVVLGLIWPGGRTLLADMAAELAMIVLLWLAVVRTAAFEQWWRDVPRSVRRRGKLIVLALVVAQLLSISANAFPLAEWAMYTSPTTEVPVAINIVGYTAGGDEIHFVPSATNRTMTTKMPTAMVRLHSEQLLRARLDPADAAYLEAVRHDLERVIELLATLHNQDSPDEAVVEVVVLRTTFTADQRRTGDGETEAVWRQEVGLP